LGFSQTVDQITQAAARLAIWLVLVCALISAGNAISRYALDLSSNAWLELQWYLFAAIVLLGAPHLLKTNGHIRVDLFYSRLGERQKQWLDLFGFVAFVMPFCGFMVWFSWPWFLESWQLGETSPNAGGLIRWPVKLLLPIGFGLLVLQSVSEVIKRLAAIRNG
jgi:TRAP-type mannitol/chloroaromatic compound transport system permease small subunit